MCQLEMSFEDKVINYDDVMNTFKKLTISKQRKVLNHFFDHIEKEDKLFNRIILGKYMGSTYDNTNGTAVERCNNIFSLNRDLYDYMRGF